MNISQKHVLDRAEAKRRVEKLTNNWKNEYGMKVDWNGDKAHLEGDIKGIHVDAHVTVTDNSIDAVGTDPGFLLRKVATAYLQNQLAACLDPSKTVDDIKG